MRTVAVALVLAATAAALPAANGATSEDTSLSITVRGSSADGAKLPVTRFTLRCAPARGTHPRPQAACDALAASDRPLLPRPGNKICLQIHYGGAEAVVVGRVNGDPVWAHFQMFDSCATERWWLWRPVVPGFPLPKFP